MCTGLTHQPHTPAVRGQDTFAGQQIHADSYDPSTSSSFRGKRVCVVGLGETSSDVVRDLVSNQAAHVYISQRGATLVLPRNVVSVPPDHFESRLTHSGPMFHRWLFGLSAIGLAAYFPVVTPTRIRPPKFAVTWLHALARHPHSWKLWRWRLGSFNFTKSDHFAYALERDDVTLLPELETIHPDAVMTVDGSRHEVDVIVYCTGYKPGLGLIPEPESPSSTNTNGHPPRTARDLYKYMIAPNHPGVAVIGMARGQIGSLVLSMSLQARWWALVVSDKRHIPDPAEMQAHIERLRNNTRRLYQPTRSTPTYANSLARNEIGCEPDMFALFRTDPKLWFTVLMGPVCGAHYRLNGVGAKPDLAREQLIQPQSIQSDDYADIVDIFTNALPTATLVLPLLWLYSRITPGFNSQGALSSYA